MRDVTSQNRTLFTLSPFSSLRASLRFMVDFFDLFLTVSEKCHSYRRAKCPSTHSLGSNILNSHSSVCTFQKTVKFFTLLTLVSIITTVLQLPRFLLGLLIRLMFPVATMITLGYHKDYCLLECVSTFQKNPSSSSRFCPEDEGIYYCLDTDISIPNNWNHRIFKTRNRIIKRFH